MNFNMPFPHDSDSDEPVVPEIPADLLAELFTAAAETLKVRPWERLSDTDWFAIVDPDSGDTHVVAIMGAARQFYAVHVYLPPEGLRFWNHFLNTGEPDITLGQYQQRMVSCEFVSWNEEDLDETDMARNEEHDPKLVVDDLDSFLFRSTLPGCVNWHPDEEEGRKLLDALRLVPRFLSQKKELPQKCYECEFGEILPWIPCYRLPDGSDRREPGSWELTTIRFPEADMPETYLADELFAARVAGHPVKKDKAWQIGSFQFGKAVISDGRPTWLMFSGVGVEPDGFALGVQLLPGTDPPEQGLRRCFLTAVEEAGYLPKTLKVASPLAHRVFAEIPEISVVMEDQLPLLEEMLGHFISTHDGLGGENPFDGLSLEAIEQIQAIMGSAPHLSEITPSEMQDLVARISRIEGGADFLHSLFGDGRQR
ncbi:DUF7309 domain-containing protein [Haloferula sargassicola]|uniref:DUF7309 domain-containing protein n=1 Tax=Haloferula sargassicola TaxID=490096 RepID=A0ABP9UPM6_9BACT